MDEIVRRTELSVLMPVKNGGEHILAAVRSTLRAMPNSSELLVIDDGSTDDTLVKLTEVSDDRLRLEVNPGEPGIANALNHGIQVSNGAYIARMDSDDICFPWRFSLQLLVMTKSERLDFLFSTAIVFGKPISPYFVLPQLPLGMKNSTFKQALTQWNPAVHPTMLARRAAVSELGGYRDVAAEDLDLWLRAAIAGKTFSRRALPTIALRLHSQQTTRRLDWLEASAAQSEISLLRSELSNLLDDERSEIGKVSLWLSHLEANGLPKKLAPWKKSSG